MANIKWIGTQELGKEKGGVPHASANPKLCDFDQASFA